MSIELATAYVSLVPETSKLEAGIKQAFNGASKQADLAGKDMGHRLAKTASKALKDGWRPDQDIMAGIPNTKLDRIGARIGQVIGKGVAANLKANEAGRKFAQGFSDGATSIGFGKMFADWKAKLSSGSGGLASIGAMAGKSLMAGVTGAATLGVGTLIGGLGTAITKGFDRLLTIDKSKRKLQALGKTTGEVADIVQTVTDSVTGTPFSLDAAFSTAVQAIGAGTEDIGKFMQNVVDAAGFAGTDIERMGLIFNQVLAKGKLTGEEMMQLMEAGLPAKSWIQKSYNLTTEQFESMQEKGEITLEMLQKAVADNAAGMGKSLGDSLQGSIDKMQTAIARLGANFLTAIFGGDATEATDTMADSIQKVTDKINEMDSWVKANGPAIQSTFQNIGKAIASSFEFGSDQIDSFMSDMRLLAGGLAQIVGAMARTNELLDGIPGMGDLSKEAKSLRDLQNNLNQFANPALNIPGGGGPNASRERRGLPPVPVGGPSGNAAASILGGMAGTSGGNVTSGNGLSYGMSSSSALQSGDWSPIDSIAKSEFGLAMTSGYRPADGPTIAGVPAAQSFHSTGQAQDYGGTPEQMLAFANYMADNYGAQLKELIFDHPSFSRNIKNGSVVGPFGSYYTMDGAGYHGDHVHLAFDTGGWLPPGTSTVTNNTGKPELVLNPDQQKALAEQGVDPNTLLHGTSKGAAPGPTPDMAAGQPDYGQEFVRSLGFIPASAGNTGVAGTSSLAQFIGMGNDIVGGLIDTGTNLAQTAVSAAITAGIAGGTFGGGVAAAPFANAAAGYGIQLAGNTAKRLSAYGFQMAGIGADALMEQLFPFGMPRWLGYDYTNFMPQLGIQQAMTSTVEKIGTDAINKAFPQPGAAANPSGPVNPSTMPGAAAPLPPPPPPGAPPNTQTSGPTTPPPPAPPIPMLPLPGLFDDGGMLPPGGLAVNMTSRPEPVLTSQQWDAIVASSSSPPMQGAPLVQNLYAQDMQDAIRQLEKVKRRDMMQYAGRS